MQVNTQPNSVAIIGMGQSYADYINQCNENVGKLADEVWGINHMGVVMRCDKVFLMDDMMAMEYQKPLIDKHRSAIPPANTYMDMVRNLDCPVFTCTLHEKYKDVAVEYPLQDVIDNLGVAYFNSTVSYAVAYAMHIGVKAISLYGIDFSYEDRDRHLVEKGRACVEFWLGRAKERGIAIGIAPSSTLMDSNCRKLYGFLEQPTVLDPNRPRGGAGENQEHHIHAVG